jgi:pimeloyl-ACP methyl ester carboxylesterase
VKNPALLDRRVLLTALAAAGAGFAATPGAAATTSAVTLLPAQRRWAAPPAAPAVERLVDAAGVRLSAWDTGGSGEVVVLLHPGTGSAGIWAYQQSVLARAGYRVIAYSRRGHGASERGPENDTTPAVDDLRALLDRLEVGRFHAVGFAAGGYLPPDFAVSWPERLLSITLACTHGGVTDPAFRQRINAMVPRPFTEMPASFRELGPGYRAANPEGVRQWEELERAARPVPPPPLRARNPLTWSAIESLRTPALLVAGGADLYMPVPLVLEYATHLHNARTVVINECGHSAYWEQPEAFNRTLLEFLKRNRARR